MTSDPSEAASSPPDTSSVGEMWGAGPMGLFTHLTRAALFLDALQEQCLAPLAITFADYSVLRVLEYEGPETSLTPTRLADILVRTTGGMTKTLDRLERRGLVVRRPHPTDRRGVRVQLTAEGLDLCREASDAYTVGRQRILAGLGDDDIERIDGALRHLVDVFEQDRRQHP